MVFKTVRIDDVSMAILTNKRPVRRMTPLHYFQAKPSATPLDGVTTMSEAKADTLQPAAAKAEAPQPAAAKAKAKAKNDAKAEAPTKRQRVR